MPSRIPRFLASIAAVAGLAAASAPAFAGGNVWWSIGIHLPPVGTVISNAPPVVYAPAPVVYAPPPVIYAPPPVVVHRAPRVVYAPPPQVVYGGWHAPGHKRKWKDRDRDGIHDRWDDRDDRRGRGW
ncbi:MAG: hypothetical protein MUC74_09930 [Ideonella sp.]|jgi:hypothetical protein|nr:hypothetical protein [Ideonella sp.]